MFDIEHMGNHVFQTKNVKKCDFGTEDLKLDWS